MNSNAYNLQHQQQQKQNRNNTSILRNKVMENMLQEYRERSQKQYWLKTLWYISKF